MKKVSLTLLAVGALMLTGCSNEDPALNRTDNGGLLTFNVSVPGSINSRSISDGTTVEDLHYVIFDESGNVLEEFVKPNAFAGDALRTQVQIQLVNGKTYKLAFWAQHPDAPYNFAGGKVTVDYSDGKKDANDELRDAFYGTYGFFECTSTFQPEGDIVLTRPFAQVNVGTADWNTVVTHNAAPTQTGMSFTASVASELSLIDGSVDGFQEVDFDLAALPDNDNNASTVEDLTINMADGSTATYTWIAMNYILVPADKETVNTVTFKHDYKNGAVSFNQVPVQRNYRTNIVGNLLTSTTDWQIVIDPIFETPDYNVPFDELYEAAANGGTVTLQTDVEIPASIVVAEGKSMVIDLNGHNLVCTKSGDDVFQVWGDLTINGNGNVYALGSGSNYAIWARGNSTVTLNGGNYCGNGSTIQTKDNAQIVINGGYYKVQNPYSGVYFVLNLQDNNPNTITVKGGTFENFDPANAMTEPVRPFSFLAPGYCSVETAPGIYQVFSGSADDVTVVTSLAELAAVDGGTAVLNGTVDMSYTSTAALEVAAGKTLTVVGGPAGGVIKGYGKSVSNDGQGMQVFVKGGNAYFENISFEVPVITPSYPGWAMSCLVTSGTAEFKNCSFVGVQCPIYQSSTGAVVLDGCTFATSGIALQGETYLPNCFRESDWVINNCDFSGCEGVWHVYDGAAAITDDTLRNQLNAGNNVWNDVTGAVRATHLP